MKNKVLFITIAAFVALFTFGFQCGKDSIAPELKYNFRIPVDVYPLKKSYRLTDTIWIEADINGKALYDTISKQNVVVDSASLSLDVRYVQLAATNTNPPDGFCQIISAANNNIYRQLYKGTTSANFSNYGCGQTSLRWKLGFKPNYTGTYAIFLSSGGSLQFCQGVRQSYYAPYSFQYKPTDLNKDLFDALPDTARKNDDYQLPYFTDGFIRKTILIVKVE